MKDTTRLQAEVARLTEQVRRHATVPRLLVAGFAVVVMLTALAWQRCGLEGCPDVERLTSYQPGGASLLLDREGVEFARLAPVEHEMVPLDSLPAHVPAAFVAVEDRRFWEHRGVDWSRVLGAVWANVRAGEFVEGSSTIPMQLSRNLFPERIPAREKTLRRKLLEVRMAAELEARFTKAEILELYLNHIYFGGGAYGVRAAARFWFDKDATELTLAETALLAALPKAPSNYDPRRDPDAARARRDLVLRLMASQGRAHPDSIEVALNTDLGVVEDPRQDRDGDVVAPYFVQHVRRMLEERFGEDLYAQPLRIHTSLDRTAQAAAEKELEAQLKRVEEGWYGRFRGARYTGERDPGRSNTEYLQGAVVLMDARTGDVLAWVGGRDFDDSRLDRAQFARRQAGSAFKPFVYAAALEQGLSPSQPILDEPYTWVSDAGRVWEPRNYSGWFEGPMSMRAALVASQNVPAVRLAAATGTPGIRDLVHRAGLNGDVPASPVVALGVTTVSPVEMTEAYSTFANRGTRVAARFIRKVESAHGDVLWETELLTEDALDPAVAYIMTDLMRDVVSWGTGYAVRRAGYRGPAAGKTGTTSDATDVWFVGFDPELVGTVWVGFDEMRPIASSATGGAIAATVWGRLMAAYRADRKAPEWPEPPAGVVSRVVDPETGRVLESGCTPYYDQARRELFLTASVPPSICPRREDDTWVDRIGYWLNEVFGEGRVALRGPIDPDLGMPRLPKRETASASR